MPTFSFQNPPGDIAFAKPKAVRLGAASYATGSWAKVLETVARAVLRDAHYRKKARPALAELGVTGKKRLLRRPMELEDGLWLEGNRAAADIVGRVRRLLAGCGYPLESAVLEYEPAPRKPPIPLKGRPPRNDPAKAFHPRKGEKAGAFARRMFSEMLADGRVPRDDFFACLDDNGGTKRVFGLLPGGHPLFSRNPMKSGAYHRSWVEPFPTRFGFPVYVNSQWRTEHLGKLASLFSKWSQTESQPPSFPPTPVQKTLFGPPEPEQLSLFPAARPKSPSHRDSPRETTVAQSNRELYARLAELLEAEFPNGIRPGDFIDQRKLRRLYAQWFDADLPEGFDFRAVLPCVGVMQGDKVFPRPSAKDGGWRKVLERIAVRGKGPLRFSRVMERHGAELMRLGVPSAEVLKPLVEDSGAFAVDGDFFAATDRALSVEDNVRAAVPPDALFADVTALTARFPYLAPDDIEGVFRDDPDCVRNTNGSYVFSSRVEFDDSEMARARRDCAEAIAKDGFFSLARLALSESAAMNDPALSGSALRRAFFKRFFGEGFDLKGQIVSPKGGHADAAVPLRVFLRERAETTLAEIESLAREYNIFITKALDTAMEETVRVEPGRFVSPDWVDFDVEAVDDAIAVRCNDVAPLGAFVSFADFPAVPGYVWNDCLLESYLRRSSRRFRIFCHSSAAKEPVGAVVRRGAPFADAPSAFAAATRAAGIAPEPDAVGAFLVASRCALRRGRELVASVVARMLEAERKSL